MSSSPLNLETENDGLLRKTLLTVVTMLGGAIAVLGTASLIAILVTSKAVEATASPTAQATPSESKPGPAGAPLRGRAAKPSSTPGNEI